MPEMLEATLRGSSRADLTTRARSLAETYFGTPCVSVVLLRTQVAGDADAPEFEASFAAQENHEVEARSYGPGVCRGCKKSSWPQSPLARAEWPTQLENRS